MDSENKTTSAPSVSRTISDPSKKLPDPNGSSESLSVEAPGVDKSSEPEKFTRKKPKSEAPIMRPDPQLQELVTKLQDRTKHVKAKLAKIKFTTPPSATTTANNSVSELSEEGILQEIERLQNLVRKIRLQSVSKNGDKNSEADDSVQKNDAEERSDDAIVGSMTDGKPVKRERRRVRPKNKKKVFDVNQLHVLYEKHINRIVSGTDEEHAKNDELQFKFGDDLENFAQKCVKAGIGCIVEGLVRVNAKNNHQAFITIEDGWDAVISSMAARKYAMDGDMVRAFVRNSPVVSKGTEEAIVSAAVHRESESVNEYSDDGEVLKEAVATASPLTRQAFVVCLVKEIGNRVFVGAVSFNNPTGLNESEFFTFKPHDSKVPMIYIPVEQCEEVLNKQKSEEVMGFLYLAQITTIKDNGRCIGNLLAEVGKRGNLKDEIKAILLHNGLGNVQPFADQFEQMWEGPLTICDKDLTAREDLRNECIFTIDPLTARDLDDAVSCKALDNGCYEIGVHISDVTHFLEESSELDELVKLRATSIYLVNEVIHMLPKLLCMKCSLLPNDDKFAFSVFWVMDENAKVISTRFTRSVIRSCTQLAYEHAQKIIDNPDEVFTVDDFPTICNGFTVTDITQRVKKLNSFAEIMRRNRFKNGSLSIDKPQFYFEFDPKTGEPISFEIASRLTANFLIEEFMLLANQSVAQFIYKRFPDISFLRSHQPPKPNAIKNLKAKLTAIGIELDMTSSKTIYQGIKGICGESSSPEVVSAAMNYLLTKPMMRAKYFCSDNVECEADLFHYALAIPIYTHFTSPIRRYPDILVHRLLAAALDYTSQPKRTPEELHELAQVCNDQKLNAKNASEESANLYFKRYVNLKKSIDVKAVVTDIYRNSVEVITLQTGHLISIQFKDQKVIVDASKAPKSICISEKDSTKPPLEIKMFSAVDVKLTVSEGKLIGFFVTPDKKQRVQNVLTSNEKQQRKRNRPNRKTKEKQRNQTSAQ